MTTELDEFLKNITPLNRDAMEAARSYQATLAKPPESLGRLEGGEDCYLLCIRQCPHVCAGLVWHFRLAALRRQSLPNAL